MQTAWQLRAAKFSTIPALLDRNGAALTALAHRMQGLRHVAHGGSPVRGHPPDTPAYTGWSQRSNKAVSNIERLRHKASQGASAFI